LREGSNALASKLRPAAFLAAFSRRCGAARSDALFRTAGSEEEGLAGRALRHDSRHCHCGAGSPNVQALPGTAIFLAAFMVAPFLGLSPGKTRLFLCRSLRQLVPSILAIAFMVGLAYGTRYSGMDTTIGLSLTRTAWVFPLYGTLPGWVGVALTGTDAGSNALFGNLQKVTAEQLHLSPILMGSATSTGGVMGKMISPQSLVVAEAATNQSGMEAEMFKTILRHSILLARPVGLLVMIYAYLIPNLTAVP
jgi:lactate permease